ncbi:DUF3429 domain-containing protein [Marinibaculum pumilum]|uniref:DUF3429 domain-containing protein n=1 Tax=Marinibaculum pumilum TaxID=1766165 RepID=A0ABV7L7F6_9PROT
MAISETAPAGTTAGNAASGTARVPAAALWLGLAGALPFLALAAALFLAPPDLRPVAQQAIAGYGAVILSFLGGIHWGLALQAGRPLWSRLGPAVLPSLLGWAALLLAPVPGLLLLAAGFIAMALADHRAARAGAAPDWYPRLRWPLSGAVTASLCLAVLAIAG